MLAQNFKAPADLGLDDAEFSGLLTVLGMLERGELAHKPRPRTARVNALQTEEPIHFNMADWHCGTACCIGGWAETVAALPLYSIGRKTDENEGLAALFYPDSYGPKLTLEALNHITPDQAAHALRSFLMHGDPCWDEALA